jgi:hypothetical protein
MNKKMKISFDFDSTLTKPVIQRLAETLLDAGCDVWILTSRLNDTWYYDDGSILKCTGYNYDIRRVAEEIGIPENKILYSEGNLKVDLYLRHNFDLHYDDSIKEVKAINNAGGVALLVKGKNIKELL